MTDLRYEVKGIAELSRAFRTVNKDLPKGFRVELLKVADKVVGTAQQRVPWITGAAAQSIKPRATTQSASIAFGGQAAPYFPWLDFGGSTGRGHIDKKAGSGAIRRPWLGAPRGEGRYIYPAIRENRPEMADAIETAVVRACKLQSFEVR